MKKDSNNSAYGLLIIGIILCLKQFINLPEFIMGLGYSIAISMMLISAFSQSQYMMKLKRFKQNFIAHIRN